MTDATVRVRFAPSPTGYLHVGGARTALFNWLYARHTGGKFILRIEDTDKERNTPEAMAAITDGLHWLGLDWDEGPDKGGDFGPYQQSQRQEIYDRHFEKLQAKDLVYEDGGAMRFRSPREDVIVQDLVCGEIRFDRSHEPDMTIRRPDGSYIFHFVSVVDDIEMGMTHVIRGEDHLSNTPKHLELYAALEATPPTFAHIPLILNPNGSKMSKRDEGASLQSYIEQGYAPEGLRNYLCLLGWSPKDHREVLETEEIIRLFDLPQINRHNASFDLNKCFWLNGQHVTTMPSERFEALAQPFIDRSSLTLSDDPPLPEVLGLVQEKVKLFSQVPTWIEPFYREDYPFDEKAVGKTLGKEGALDRLQSAREKLMTVEPWNEEALHDAVEALSQELEVGFGALAQPLRVALTGTMVGPNFFPLLVLLGKERTLARLERALREHTPA